MTPYAHAAPHYAAERGHVEICQMLVAAGAPLNSVRSNRFHPLVHGWTPLHGAAARGHPETCKLLVNAGADVNSLNKHQEKPLDLAKKNGHKDCVDILTASGGKFQMLGTD